MSVAYHSRVMIHGLWLIAIPNGKGKAVKLWQGKKGEESNVLKFFICLALCIPLWSVSRAAVPGVFPLPVGTDVSNRFVGTVYRNDLIQTDSVYQLPQTNVIILNDKNNFSLLQKSPKLLFRPVRFPQMNSKNTKSLF